MRLEGGPGQVVEGEAWLYLTEAEAEQLVLALNFYFEEAPPRDPEWHHHITTTDPTITNAIEASAL